MAIYTIRKAIGTFVAALSVVALHAQDPHFTQFYTFASHLNPGLVGNYDGSFRAAVTYRNQWAQALQKSAYQTVGADVDVSFLEGYLRKSKLAAGVAVFNDRSGQAGLSYLNATVTLAYHQGFGKDGNHRLSLGLQGGFIQKRIDDPLFGDQFVDHSQTPKTSTEENLKRGIYNGDLNVGLYWKSNFKDVVRLGLGVGAYHLLEPKENFITEANLAKAVNGLDYRRITADFNLEAFFGKKKNISISPEFVFLMQGPAREINPALFFSYYFQTGFRKNNSIHAGVRYRVGDAVIPMIQVEFRNIRLGAAYDVNISPLKTTTRNQGAFEISLSYVGESIRYFKGSKSLPSRRF
jgi:type IX secretion system PorP/SprF family membrane protein